MKFYIVSVIYNEYIEKTKVYNSLIENQEYTDFDVSYIIIDNSTQFEYMRNNSKFELPANAQYYSMGGNSGLSKAYTLGLTFVEKTANHWVITSDQDTLYPSNFLQKLSAYIKAHQRNNVFAPVAKNGEKLVSPCKISGVRFPCVTNKNYNLESKEKQVFINSGLCINAILFEDIKYDEHLFLDFVDYDLIFQMQHISNYFPFVINDLIIQQGLSGQMKNNMQVDSTRFRIYCKDGRYFYSKWYSKDCLRYRGIFARSVKLSLRHKNPYFIKCFLRTIFHI